MLCFDIFKSVSIFYWFSVTPLEYAVGTDVQLQHGFQALFSIQINDG